MGKTMKRGVSRRCKRRNTGAKLRGPLNAVLVLGLLFQATVLGFAGTASAASASLTSATPSIFAAALSVICSPRGPAADAKADSPNGPVWVPADTPPEVPDRSAEHGTACLVCCAWPNVLTALSSDEDLSIGPVDVASWPALGLLYTDARNDLSQPRAPPVSALI